LNASQVYQKLIEFHTEFENNTNEKYKYVIDASKAKLEKYFFYNGMPSMKLFTKAIRILDPLFFKLNNVDNNEYVKDFPELEFCVD
jgi:hypothetical protein